MVEVTFESFTVQEERGEKEAGFLWKPEKQQHESEVHIQAGGRGDSPEASAGYCGYQWGPARKAFAKGAVGRQSKVRTERHEDQGLHLKFKCAHSRPVPVVKDMFGSLRL